MKLLLKIVLPLGVVAVGGFISYQMILSRPPVKIRERTIQIPTINYFEVQPESYQLSVKAQGTVVPKTETVLSAEVSGKIIYVSPSLVSGGFIETKEVLVRLDPRDYELYVIKANSAVVQAELNLIKEEAEAKIALKEWGKLGNGVSTPLLRREPQIAQAKSALESAKAHLDQAKLNLLRTEIRSPFIGRVRSKHVDLGQFVSIATPVSTIYAVDYAEIRLPLPDNELAYLTLPLGLRSDHRKITKPKVVIRAYFAGSEHFWVGRIVRTEGEIDPNTRVIHAIAEVKNPYGIGKTPERPPLAIGMFVEAEIMGRWVYDAFRVPRNAIRDSNQILVVDKENRIRFREVELVWSGEKSVIIKKGLSSGERVALVSLESVFDGMKVHPVAIIKKENPDKVDEESNSLVLQ